MGKVLSTYHMPGTPGKVMRKNEGELIKQGKNRSYVGRILYPVKKCIPDCINAICELCGHLKNPGEDQWATLTRLVGYLLGLNRVIIQDVENCFVKLRDVYSS